ncbi:helix-turn-helix domain-containing protein [Halococcus salsus]|uniref:helix-turn-helix domain-containing protein n=1 Tax=Halococcus salsus TaxID=2162894 RepID=UPI00135B54E0|nr:helix-turn-helix domain-containing protein [Halococcus salsus]
MKRVRITLSPSDAYLPPVYRLLTRESPFLRRVHIVNWNVAEPPVGFLLHIWGEYERSEEALRSGENVRDVAFFPESDDEAYCFLAAESTTVGRALFENFTRDDLLTVPPIECHRDGSSTYSLIGTESAIQNALDGLPEGVNVEIRSVGTGRITAGDTRDDLSPRQREAVRIAVEIGYYSVPRRATTEDVAHELECTAATASEHLRRAESHVFTSLFEP